MLLKKLKIKIIDNMDIIAIYSCFGMFFCFNLLMSIFLTSKMFKYDGITDMKVYDDIKVVDEARAAFVYDLLSLYACAILFIFPLIMYFFVSTKINLNAVLVQMLPVMIMFGYVLFVLL